MVQMGLRIVSVLLLAIVAGCIHANARSLTSDTMVLQMDDEVPSIVSINVSRKEEVSTLCQQFATEATQYLADNETRAVVVSTLHVACSRLHYLKHQCIKLVDYYVPLFFTEIATMQPDLLCDKVNFCQDATSVRLPQRDDACTLCQRVVREVLTKLQDPDTQLEVIEVLLKGCSKVENFVQECKKFVFEYGPVILANAEKFLESTDVCTAMHVCKGRGEAASLKDLLLLLEYNDS